MAKASTQTATKPKGKAIDPKAEAAIKAKGAAKAAETEAKAGELVVTRLNANALSVDVGPIVLKTIASANAVIEEANAAIAAARQKQYHTLSITTEAIVKAAKADPAINLNDVFGENKAKKKHLVEQLLIALGVKEVFITEGGKATAVYTKAAKPYFPSGTDVKDSPEYRRKRTTLQNWSHLLNKCIEAAAGVMDWQATTEYDDKKATLLIGGPSVEKHFGVEKGTKVALNEKPIEGGTGAKPSFSELQRVAQLKRGVEKASRGRVNTGPVMGGVTDPDKAIVSMMQSLAKALEAYKGKDVTEAMEGAMDDVVTAWEAIQ